MGGGLEPVPISNISSVLEFQVTLDEKQKVLVVTHERSKSDLLQVKPITETEVTPLETENVDL